VGISPIYYPGSLGLIPGPDPHQLHSRKKVASTHGKLFILYQNLSFLLVKTLKKYCGYDYNYFILAEVPGTARVNLQPAEHILFKKEFSKMSSSAFSIFGHGGQT